jgi:hypothetical protein
MGCIYSDFEGNCDQNPELEDGICIYEDDPDPSYGCQYYESDYTCPTCGQDLNVDECDCE